jgi:hypothetical protein
MMIEENIKCLFDEHIKKVRYTDDILGKSYVFDNQIDTAKEIIYNFYTKGNNNRWCLLFAEMQSGKSGTFFSVPYIISRNKILVDKLGIDMFENEINVFLLTGMNEKELISQFESDIESFTGMSIKKNVLHNSEMKKFLSKDESEWNTSDRIVIDRMRKNSLILIDESHYGSDRNQILDKFLRKIIKINPNGDNKVLKDCNIYVVSISATPMAEFINANIPEFKKKIIPLKNSDGYYGIEEMFRLNKIRNSYDLKDNSSVDLFLDNILKIEKDGYILVRCTQKQQNKISERISMKGLEIKTINYDRYSRDRILDNLGINDILYESINNKTIIFLKGLLRAGKRVDTKNVIMIHDTSVSNSDTTVQSLLGRCCGYNKNKDILIYCDKLSATKYRDWVSSGFSLDKVPDKSKNVLKKGQNKFYIDKVEILKYKMDDSLDHLYNKTSRTKPERQLIIDKHLNNPKYLDKFFIGSVYDYSQTSIESTYKSKDGYLCIGDTVLSRLFNSKNNPNPVGTYVITGLMRKEERILEFSIGVIKTQEILTNDKTMYHKTNSLD